ncbi:DUF418 domain-containing protein [Nocardia otitidiscaviarum]|uniref:DUF418 domain-containing protein n=1 Tax=Nocardia otitidiscaviarum TaxID=1823 RepID=UPI001894B184|nr:DUF418 domain-containing protein [Nocardia otitidiscaviarum]MBF6180453.1 DUF418 domain-containing protein [Nocardia otitidiscaviarum]
MPEPVSAPHTGASATSAQPTDRPTAPQPSSRVAALDVLRGIAILGTLGTNVWIFTDPEGLLGYLQGTEAANTAWMWTERVLQQVAQGKFLGLLTIMFGIGLAIQQRSAARAGRPWPGKYPWRALLLFVDGLLHFLLFTEFDVLMGYAVTGLVVAYILATSPRAQRRWLLSTAAVHLTFLALAALALLFAPRSDSGPAEPLDPNPYADGSFWDLVVFRWEHLLLFRLETIVIFPMSIALFLVGARLFQAGLFAPEGGRIRKRLMVIGAVAAPLDMGLGVFGGGDLILITRYGIAPFVALGILGLVAWFYRNRPRPGWVGRRFGEVGRMALSCYILQNVVASTICYGWGLGLAARVSADARVPFTIAVYLGVAAAMLVFAHLWLRRFDRGPVEWLWNACYRAIAERGSAPATR